MHGPRDHHRAGRLWSVVVARRHFRDPRQRGALCFSDCSSSRAWLAALLSSVPVVGVSGNNDALRRLPDDPRERRAVPSWPSTASPAVVGRYSKRWPAQRPSQHSRVSVRLRPERRPRPDSLGSVPHRVTAGVQHPGQPDLPRGLLRDGHGSGRWGWRCGPGGPHGGCRSVVAGGNGAAVVFSAARAAWLAAGASLLLVVFALRRAARPRARCVASVRVLWVSTAAIVALGLGLKLVTTPRCSMHDRGCRNPGRVSATPADSRSGPSPAHGRRPSGHGCRSRRDGQVFPAYRTAAFDRAEGSDRVADKPHSSVLQWAVETGIPGALLFLGCALCAWSVGHGGCWASTRSATSRWRPPSGSPRRRTWRSPSSPSPPSASMGCGGSSWGWSPAWGRESTYGSAVGSNPVDEPRRRPGAAATPRSSAGPHSVRPASP